MPKQKISPNIAYTQNLAAVSACLDLGGAVIQKVMGSDAISNQLQGETQTLRDLQELIAARLQSALSV
jgi:hypothetical protein